MPTTSSASSSPAGSTSPPPPAQDAAPAAVAAAAPAAAPGSGAGDAGADLSLTVLPRKNISELRSYRYFLDVAAPCLAGSFDIAFWTDQVPRACYDDPALWHAVVSLGSVFETYSQLVLTGTRGAPPERNVFALQQFNLAIRHLTDPSLSESSAVKTPSWDTKWRTLVVSVVFMAICILEGLFDDAHMHFQYGSNLLREIEGELAKRQPSRTTQQRARAGRKRAEPAEFMASPISLESLRSLMGSFELRDKVHFEGGDIVSAKIHSSSDIYSAWKAYSEPAPQPMTLSGSGSGGAGLGLTVARLAEACRASQSLMNAFIMNFAEAAGPSMEGLPDEVFEVAGHAVPVRYRSLFDTFYNIDAAIATFTREFEMEMASSKKRRGQGKTDQLQIQLLLLCLRQSHATNRLVLAQFPGPADFIENLRPGNGPSPPEKLGFGSGCKEILDLTEQILALQHAVRESKLGSAAPVFLKPPITTNVFMVALNASTWTERKRALALLRRPQLEGLLEHSMAMSIAEAMLEREIALTREYRRLDAASAGRERRMTYGEEEEEEDVDDGLLSWLELDEEDTPFDPRAKMFINKLRFTGRREAILHMWTWHEHASGQRGWTKRVRW